MKKIFSSSSMIFFIFITINASEISMYDFTESRTDSNLTEETVIESYKQSTFDQSAQDMINNELTNIMSISIIAPIRPTRRINVNRYRKEPQLDCCSVLTQTASIFKNDIYNICLKCDYSCLDESINKPENIHPQVRRSRCCCRYASLATCCITCTVITMTAL